MQNIYVPTRSIVLFFQYCIISNFLAFDRYSDPLMMSRNSRIANLCDITGLSSRRYTGDVLEQMKKPIDYDRVDERLEKEKAISVAYIREALGKND